MGKAPATAQGTEAPAPTTLDQSPQASTATRLTVTAWPAVRRMTANVACWVPGASATAKLPLPLCAPASMWALVGSRPVNASLAAIFRRR